MFRYITLYFCFHFLSASIYDIFLPTPDSDDDSFECLSETESQDNSTDSVALASTSAADKQPKVPKLVKVAKTIADYTPCVCKDKCPEKVNTAAQKRVFEEFWSLETTDEQIQFITNYTRPNISKRPKCKDPTKNNNYYLPVPLSSGIEVVRKVCKTMFKNTLMIDENLLVSGLISRNNSTKINVQCEYLYSQRGNPLILVDGYKYFIKKAPQENNPKTIWRCVSHASRRCNAVVTTLDNSIISIKASHNHEPPSIIINKSN